MMEVIENLTKLEVFLIITLLIMTVAFYFKLGLIDTLKCYNMDLRISNHNLYAMYMQLSSSSLEYVSRWQDSLKENKELFEKIHTSPQNNS